MSSSERVNLLSRSRWEPIRGYGRAVRVGERLFISGTTAMKANGDVVGQGSPYDQTRYVISIIRRILNAAEMRVEDVVRTRLFVTNMAKWDEYARAHHEVFERIRPASSIVQVQKLFDPRLMIEMEVDAVAGAETVRMVQIPEDEG